MKVDSISELEQIDQSLLLAPTPFIESEHPEVVRFAREAAGDAESEVEKGIRIFYAVRDAIRYDPYNLPRSEEGYRASRVLADESAYCIPKSILLAATARALGIPAVLGFADVKNHLTTEKLRETMGGSDLFIYHGYALLRLDGKWLKASTAFNLSLCEKFQVLPLEFDGRSDALMHPFDANNRRHMEYVNERGFYTDYPFQEVRDAFREFYPNMEGGPSEGAGQFEEEKPLTS